VTWMDPLRPIDTTPARVVDPVTVPVLLTRVEREAQRERREQARERRRKATKPAPEDPGHVDLRA
jgi:hypothetical protein